MTAVYPYRCIYDSIVFLKIGYNFQYVKQPELLPLPLLADLFVCGSFY